VYFSPSNKSRLDKAAYIFFNSLRYQPVFWLFFIHKIEHPQRAEIERMPPASQLCPYRPKLTNRLET